MSTTVPCTKKPFASSILLWIRTDKPRQQGMDYWKGPHSKIISPTPGFNEYRQIHLAGTNSGLWPATAGVETAIPADRRIDGVAEVTFASVLSPLLGRKQTRLAYQDEINVFRRTLLYAGPPNSTRWYNVGGPGERTGARALIYLRRRKGVGTRTFRKFVTDQRFHASLILGFADSSARSAFFESSKLKKLSDPLASVASAVHAYDVSAALTYVTGVNILPQYQQ